VPYSEHSTFRELTAFLNWLQPAAVIPTVNTRASNVQKQLLLLRNGSEGGGDGIRAGARRVWGGGESVRTSPWDASPKKGTK
jgi:hypothetical protein